MTLKQKMENKMKKLILTSIVMLFGLSCAFAENARAKKDVRAKFEPPAGKVLVFVGQDNASVGGTADYTNGYVDNVGVPGGITHYVYFSDGWHSRHGYDMLKGAVSGLNSTMTWGAGPMNMKLYADSPKLKDCILHISISMEGGYDRQAADGKLDHLIDELGAFLKTYENRKFLIRIGYEFNTSHNNYDPESFKKAWIRMVDKWRAAGLQNFATVFASNGTEKYSKWAPYYPGDEYVDWVGYSHFKDKKGTRGSACFKFAREHNKPVFIAESAPKGVFLDKADGPQAWAKWYEPFFQIIEKNKDVVRAISYINCNWDAQPMWNNWGNTRLEENDYVRKEWLKKMNQPQFINAEDKPVELCR